MHSHVGPNLLKEDIPIFDVTPGILAISDMLKISFISHRRPPGSYMRAIILEKKLTSYVDFVIKYFMIFENIGENKVGVEIVLFLPITVLNTPIFIFKIQYIKILGGGVLSTPPYTYFHLCQ